MITSNVTAKWLLQASAYGAFIAFIAGFAGSPPYQWLEPDEATVKLSLRHTGKRLGDCRERSSQEMSDLPENMRAPLVCPRERSPLWLELDINDTSVYSQILPPRGLHDDGRASTYRRLTVPAGLLRIEVRLKDDARAEGFQFRQTYTTHIEPAEVLVIDFDEQASRFEFK